MHCRLPYTDCARCSAPIASSGEERVTFSTYMREQLDLERFEKHVANARTEQPQVAARTLVEALGLWRGTPLGDVAAPFASVEAARLEELRLAALESRIDADLASDATTSSSHHELEALIAEHPYRERLRGQLMLALYMSGRQADALEAYQDARRVLVEELGIDPGPELQQLEAAILRQDPSLEPRRPWGSDAGNLPVPPSPLIGRDFELVAVTAMLRDSAVRLVTLTGTGGTGKTRLAVAAGEELRRDHEDGVFFVDLSALDDPELGCRRRSRARSGSARPLARRSSRASRTSSTSGSCSSCSTTSSASSPPGLSSASYSRRSDGSKCLATSRTALRLSGEQEYPVPPLPVLRRGDAVEVDALGRNAAVELFVSRARATRHDFALTEREQHVRGRDLPRPRRPPAGARARGGSHKGACAGGAARPARTSAGRAHGRAARRPRAPADAQGSD